MHASAGSVCVLSVFVSVSVCARCVCKQLVFTPACIICASVGVDVCKNLNKSIVQWCLPGELVSRICPPTHTNTYTRTRTHTTTALKHLLARCANPRQRLTHCDSFSASCQVTAKSFAADTRRRWWRTDSTSTSAGADSHLARTTTASVNARVPSRFNALSKKLHPSLHLALVNPS